MKKVYQTIIDVGKGNCMQAALASLFELGINEVPDFLAANDKWFESICSFVESRGYEHVGDLYNGETC
jgi:hypothetical protein